MPVPISPNDMIAMVDLGGLDGMLSTRGRVRIPMPGAKVRSTCFGLILVEDMLDDDKK